MEPEPYDESSDDRPTLEEIGYDGATAARRAHFAPPAVARS
jgi:tripartite-type tricarboxylate transporter receptor subunit TctC